MKSPPQWVYETHGSCSRGGVGASRGMCSRKRGVRFSALWTPAVGQGLTMAARKRDLKTYARAYASAAKKDMGGCSTSWLGGSGGRSRRRTRSHSS
jgi:hypothetical protein